MNEKVQIIMIRSFFFYLRENILLNFIEFVQVNLKFQNSVNKIYQKKLNVFAFLDFKSVLMMNFAIF